MLHTATPFLPALPCPAIVARFKEIHSFFIERIDAVSVYYAALLEIPAKPMDEPRSLVIGMISGNHWSGVITYRGNRIRIISVRRSRKEEVTLYES